MLFVAVPRRLIDNLILLKPNPVEDLVSIGLILTNVRIFAIRETYVDLLLLAFSPLPVYKLRGDSRIHLFPTVSYSLNRKVNTYGVALRQSWSYSSFQDYRAGGLCEKTCKSF
jgi:hypothetical protein